MTDTGSSSRLQSLDAFRGATIAAMILVNNPGSWSNIYTQLGHSRWNGWTFTDWVFPFFLWIVGVAMTLSFAKRKERGDDRGKIFLHVVRRALIIFALGLFLNGFPFGAFLGNFSFASMRIPGVLQRIALCYMFAGSIFLFTGLRAQIWWVVGLLASYWAAVMLIPVPGFGPGVLQPTGCLPWYIDSNLLAGHTWSGAPAPGFDPEGILSTIPAIATTLLGVLAGQWLRTDHSREEKTAWMFVFGSFFLLAGVIMDIWFPINKNLWTSSYVIFMAGWALVCFSVFYWLIDVKGHVKWARPFVIYGMNAIAVYVLSDILEVLLVLITFTGPDGSPLTLKALLYNNVFAAFFSPVHASTLFAAAFVLVMYFVAWTMWKRKWFFRV